MTVDQLLEARNDVRRLQRKQEKIFSDILAKIPARKQKKFEGLKVRMEDFLFNNIYYSRNETKDFIEKLYDKEILLEIE
jgi:phage terminase Nu1 subunit (DNA packaging protein)|tara:strand:+ start:226 stop:462 length:237 start_codon:yes stop_codon:yes gene_type:complete